MEGTRDVGQVRKGGIPGYVLVAVGGETVVHVAGVARHVKGRRIHEMPAIA